MKRHKITLIIVAIAAVLLIGCGGAFMFYSSQLQPVSDQQEEVVFEIKAGQTQAEVLQQLKEQDLIKNTTAAKLCSRLNGLQDMKFGIFTLDRSWDTETILETLNDATKAKQDGVMLTFKEGIWAKDIAAILEKELGVDHQELIALWNDDAYLRKLMKKYSFLSEDILKDDVRIKLEGYLFPETYVFDKDATMEEITETFLDHFQEIYTKHEQDIKASDMSMQELITLASVVQYEASKPEDMKMIAGVFFNRLAQGMKLQSSVTVCYALYEDLTSGEDCEVNYDIDSPYNTYQHEGLPIGPILNPGEDALTAVLHPTDNDYLFFVADVYGDGTVYYAKTYEEQLANQEKFHLNK